MARTRRTWGKVRKLPSGRFQASYVGPDGARYTGPVTFSTKTDAGAWLAAEQTRIGSGVWAAECEVAMPAELPTVSEFVTSWIAGRTTREGELIRPRTRQQYERLNERHIVGDPIGTLRLDDVRVADVRAWWARLPADKPTWRAHAYRLLRAAFNTAVADELIDESPCRVRSGGAATRQREVRPATAAELETITAAMPERLQAAVLIAAWCAVRFGELIELRRSDVDVKAGVIHVRRAAVRVKGETVVGPPKTAAGVRTVAIPPHVLPAVKKHLREHVKGRDALLFPSERKPDAHLAMSTLARSFAKAREAADRKDLRWHDLRHTGAVMAAQAGATLAELQARLGHASAAAALIYQHAADGRDAEIAKRMSKLAKTK